MNHPLMCLSIFRHHKRIATKDSEQNDTKNIIVSNFIEQPEFYINIAAKQYKDESNMQTVFDELSREKREDEPVDTFEPTEDNKKNTCYSGDGMKAPNVKFYGAYHKKSKYSLSKYNKYIIFSLIRFEYNKPKVKHNPVLEETIKFCDINYELISVVVHSGSTSDGHYYANCKSMHDNNWYRYDDLSSYKINYNDFNGGQYTMLLYHRLNISKNINLKSN